jgi:hypothetical protein
VPEGFGGSDGTRMRIGNCLKLCIAVLGLAGLSGCAGEDLLAVYIPDLSLGGTAETSRPLDNTISLQGGSTEAAETFSVIVHAGRATAASDTVPAPPAVLLLPGIVRFRATLQYDPEFIEFERFTPGTYFEQASGQQPTYNVTNQISGDGTIGNLTIDITVPSNAGTVRKGDLMTLEFRGIEETNQAGSGRTALRFEGGFGTVERNGQVVTGVSYYGGTVTVSSTSL